MMTKNALASFSATFPRPLPLLTSFLPFAGIGRTLIPRYFRSIFEGGVTDLRYELRHPKESFHNTSITMDCDQCTVVTLHGKPTFTKVRERNNNRERVGYQK